eukprot:15367207-Ditylum_brightwellii.AAC.1
MKALTSIDGSTAYMMVMDHHVDAMWTVCTSNKRPPLVWLNKILMEFERKGEHYTMIDLGGESENIQRFNSYYNNLGTICGDKTPYKIITGKRPDLSKLQTFGCRVYAWPPG